MGSGDGSSICACYTGQLYKTRTHPSDSSDSDKQRAVFGAARKLAAPNPHAAAGRSDLAPSPAPGYGPHERMPRGVAGGGESSSNLLWTVAHREHPQNSKG